MMIVEDKNNNTIPFYKKALYKLKDKFKINYFKLTLLLIFLVLGVLIWRTATQSSITIAPRDPYDKSGFVQKDDINESNLTLENERFGFSMDTETTHFTVVDRETGLTWHSKPEGNPDEMPNDVLELFILYYERTLESPKAMRVNKESIKHEKYAFRQIDNSIEVLYTVGGKHEISVDDLPKKIPVDKMESRILPKLNELAEESSSIRRNLRFFTSQYLLYESEKESYYYLRNIDSKDGIQLLYDLLFVHGGYTQEDFREDNAFYGFESETLPIFEFSVKYTLTEDGIDFKLINDSIVESEEYPLAYIDILPYFGSGNISSNGYVMIPDGSGVLIGYNNNKYNSLPYNKRIYGDDYAITSTNEKLDPPKEHISLPMYGMNNNGGSFIHVIEEGAAMTSIHSGFKTEYSNNQLKHKYIYSSYRYFIRERDAYTFSGLGSEQKVTVWTEDYNREDFSTKIMFINDSDQSYVGMAKLYQSYLIDRKLLKSGGDITKEALFNLTLLGGYKTTDHFLGIPYESVESLTNVEQAKTIIEELLEKEIDNINLSYQGWANEGLKPNYMSRIDFDKAVGKKDEFRAFANYLAEQNINFTPEVNVNTAYTDARIKVKNDAIYDMFWNNVVRYDFNLATMLPDKTTTPIYPINASNSVAFMSQMEKAFNDYGFTSIGFIDHGNVLSSSFHKANVVFRNDAVDYFNQSLNGTSFKEIMMRNPFLYAYPYLTNALDVATSGTDYQIVNQSIPFVQLVLSGHVDYSGKAFNVDDRHSLEWHKLKSIETGSNLNFTWSYEDTVQLTQTEYSDYYSTNYKNWFDKSVGTYHELNDLGIYQSNLINHEVLDNSGSLVKVTYANGLMIQIDYNNLTYEVLNEV